MKNKVILAVGAHPDDMELGVSGTVSKWIEEGATGYYLICTDGSRGSSNTQMTLDNFKDVEKRVRARAKIWGKAKGYKFAENFIRIKLP